MFDQVIIGTKSSVDDFDASMASREIGEPKKKSIKETVPFSNKTYDFTKINGEIYWEERTLKYVFEIIADSPEELEEKKKAFKSWVMNVHEEWLHDPYIKEYHFVATFDSIECDDSEIEKSTITVTFTAYPYLIADEESVFTHTLEADVEKTVAVMNRSGHRISPTIVSTVEATVVMDNTSYGIPSGEMKSESFSFATGMTVLKITAAESGTIAFKFYEEVF